ncbi:uncharacterized protein BDV14DRAFT_64022 [Aspergillus stella-maris]|uniref:uncharacterized protein n=1 Tax=Aspergillus stella-maris TaxID=1810926 RepID=UPI003CCD8195
MSYQLSVSIHGPGETSHAHWGFTIHTLGQEFGDLLHVRLITTTRFQFENRSGHGLTEQDAWGLAPITLLDSAQRATVVEILEAEEPPTGGKDCQDWIVDALVELEVAELVEPGTAETWAARRGKETVAVRGEVGEGWVALNGR